MSKLGGFTFFSSYHESLRDLDKEDRRDLLEAIVDYVFDDIAPEFTGFKKTIWTLILPNLTTSKNKSNNAKKDTKKKQTKNKSKSKTNQNKINDLLEDKDKEEDKEEEKGIEDKSSSSTTRRNLYDFTEQNFGRPLSPLECEKINKWQDDFSDDIIEYAIRKSVLSNKRNFSYVNGILKNWKANGYRTLQEIKDNDYSERPRPEPSIPAELFDYNWLEDDSDE